VIAPSNDPTAGDADLRTIGLGRIGTAVALRAKAFNFRVVFYDPICRTVSNWRWASTALQAEEGRRSIRRSIRR
jgi:lactate dehydrogenase-like 2-hydroxyacid dehydrogenase